MPKIITDVKNRIIAEAGRQIKAGGYAKTTMRSIAAACDIAVGTLYNYFDSKDIIIATFVAANWKKSLGRMVAYDKSDVYSLLHFMYNELCAFSAEHKTLFEDTAAAEAVASTFSENHKRLRAQLAEIILPVCKGEDASFTAHFAAEALLVWTVSGEDFERIYRQLIKIIDKD